MKNLLPITLLIFTCLSVKAQKVELSLQAGGTYSHFANGDPTLSSIVYQGFKADGSATSFFPYGNKYALGYAAGLQFKLVAKSGLILGFAASYDQLRSKANVNYIAFPSFNPNGSFTTGLFPNPQNATGAVYLSNYFVNLSPGIGYRFSLKKISIDVLPGVDIGLAIKSHDKGKAVYSDKDYNVNEVFPKPHTDVRLSLGAAVNYQRYSINCSFARGVKNYLPKNDPNLQDAPDIKLYSQLFRLGVGYRIL